MLDLCLLGTGGMMPLPKRALTSLMLRYNGCSILIDCGEGTQVTIRQKGWSMHDVDAIFFTHYHGDHISGLPGILLSMANAERKESVKLFGPPGLKRVVSALCVIAPGLPFDLEFYEYSEDEEKIFLKEYEITTFKVNHTVTCYGYTIDIRRKGKFDVERAKALDIPLKAWNPLQKGSTLEIDGKTYTPDMVLGPERKGLKVTYVTDTRPTESILKNAPGSDLFICEGMYGEAEKDTDAVKKKHMTMKEAAQLAAKAGVNELWFTHYSPSLVRPDIYLDEMKKIFPNTVAPRDRRSLDLNFEED